MLVYWSWRDRTFTVTQEGPEDLDALLADSAKRDEEEETELDGAGGLKVNQGLSREDIRLQVNQ